MYIPSGFIYINKPQGLTSYDVIRKLKKRYKVKMGHSGTLDPMAVGLLIVALGRATKFIEFLHHLEKEYIATIKLGIETDTYDMEGEVLNTDENFKLKEDELRKVLENFPRKYVQIPPKYSAKKISGVRAYELARKNVDFELEGREVEIYDIKLLHIDEAENEFTVSLVVSTGFFVRSFAMDLAKMMGTYGTLKTLVRTRIGHISIEQAQLLEEELKIVPIEETLNFLPSIELPPWLLKRYINGNELVFNADDGTYRVFSEGNFIGVGIVREGILKSKKLALTRF